MLAIEIGAPAAPGNARCWIFGKRGFHADEHSQDFIDAHFKSVSPEDAELLKAELRKIGYDPV